MARNNTTSAVVDNILRVLTISGAVSAAIIAPNFVQVLDKPISKYFSKLDKRTQQREQQRLFRYMRQQGLVKYSSEGYQHGVLITKKGKTRAQRIDIDNLGIDTPQKWDNKWRLVLFDIPEKYKTQRDQFSLLLKAIGFYRLQKSVWLCPYKCKEEIYAASKHHDIQRFVTYIEASHIDRGDLLIRHFFK